ncbi:hypothetical protein DM02DRAFT_660344 [Periconia macrospinosa]|uniref:Mid2 domain-containing protein n=1 Tax=Periconia macrospinosa TaxID=97972 RepID=A0A2V1DAU1_9PLEO|nr:hypothetical protein DM02DRAFT_660344 [Periconia macrospinosa]
MKEQEENPINVKILVSSHFSMGQTEAVFLPTTTQLRQYIQMLLSNGISERVYGCERDDEGRGIDYRDSRSVLSYSQFVSAADYAEYKYFVYINHLSLNVKLMKADKESPDTPSSRPSSASTSSQIPLAASATFSVTEQPTSKITPFTKVGTINAYAVIFKRNNFDFATPASRTTINTAIPNCSNNNQTSKSSATQKTGAATAGSNAPGKPNTPAPPPQGGLTTRTSISLGVGAGILAMSLILGALLFYLRWRKLKRQKEIETIAAAAALEIAQRKEQDGMYPPTEAMVYAHEMENQQGKWGPQEVDRGSAKVEVEGNGSGDGEDLRKRRGISVRVAELDGGVRREGGAGEG